MKCPKDADPQPNKGMICGISYPDIPHPDVPYNYICTRKEGHKGNHHAHGKTGHCCKVWK